jgi:signal transduction histidine kinase
MPLNRLRAPNPLRQLLYVEWVLLMMAAFMTLPLARIEPNLGIEWGKLLIILILGLMGLHLPQRHRYKLVYTAAELGLLLLLTAMGGELPTILRLMSQLGLIVVIRSCQLFQGWGRLCVLANILGIYLFAIWSTFDDSGNQGVFKYLSVPPEPWQINVLKINSLIFLTLGTLLILLLVNALLLAHRRQQALIKAHQQLQCYAAKVEDQATLYERNRIAREIHDSLGHSLTAQAILLENALLFLPQDINRTQSYLREAKTTAYHALEEVSRSVGALRTRSLPGKHLPTEIPVLVNEMCKTAEIDSECKVEVAVPLTEEVSLALFRIVQEALTNVVKHSQANAVHVKLFTKGDRLHLQILDNGKGFDPNQNTTGFGLQGIRERAITLGGYCQLWSAPDAGCRVRVIVPFPRIAQSPA